MEERDFERIAVLIDGRFNKFAVEFEAKLDQKLDQKFEQKLAPVYQKLEQLDQKVELLDRKVEQLDRKFEQKLEQLDRKLDRLDQKLDKSVAVLVDGHNMLSEKLDRVESAVTVRVDAVDRRLDLHLTDTRAHGASCVREK